MYPIISLLPSFTFVPKGNNIKEQRFVTPTVSIDIKYPMGSKFLAIVKLIYSIDCVYEDQNTRVTASATNTYSITKNDEAELLSSSDTVYYCAKMLERDLQLHLYKIAADETMPKIGLPLVSYHEWMNGKGNTLQFSAN